jgi:hypothetical protein
MASAPKDIEKILQTCLDSILSGRGTIESVLAAYPDLEDVLRPQIEAALWINARKKMFDPRPEFISESRKRLESQIQKELAKKPAPPRFTLQGFLQSLQERRFAYQVALVLILLFAFIFISVSGVAYAAKETVPGDILYPVKLMQERVEVTFTLSNKGKAQLYTGFAQRRLLEIQVLVLEGRYEYLQPTISLYEDQIGEAIRLVNEVARNNDSEAQPLATQLEDTLSGQTMVLEILSKAVPQNRKAEIDKAVEISRDGVGAMQELRSNITPQSTITPSPSITYTNTQTLTSTITPSPGLIQTITASLTGSPTNLTTSSSVTPTAIVQVTLTPTPANTLIPTSTPSPTNVPVPTRTPSPIPTQPPAITEIPSPIATVQPSDTPTPIITEKTPKPTNTHRPSPQPTNTNRPTEKP